MAAVGKWGGRIGYVGNLKGCPYIHCNPPFVHSSNKAWSVPRLLRHSGSGLGGIRGGTGGGVAQNLQGYRGPPRRGIKQRQRLGSGGAAPCVQWVSMSLGTVLFSPKASCHQQGAFALLDTPPDGNHGDNLQPQNSQGMTNTGTEKAVKSTAYFFPVPFW